MLILIAKLTGSGVICETHSWVCVCEREIFQFGLHEVGGLGLHVGGIFLMAPD